MKSDLGWLKIPYGFKDKEKRDWTGQKIILDFDYRPCNFSFLRTQGLKLFNYFAFMNV